MVTLFRRSDMVKSQAGLGLSAVFLVLITVAGGLGCCAIIGIPFNASTTQIIPFLALGLGVNSMFHLVPTYAAICGHSEILHEVRKSSLHLEIECFEIITRYLQN